MTTSVAVAETAFGVAGKIGGGKAMDSTEFKTIDPSKTEEEFRNYKDSLRLEMVKRTYTQMHENQSYEYAKRKREEHLKFDKCLMTVWEMGHYLDAVHDESDPDTDLSQLQHAIQTAEACRKAFPGEEYDWFHVVCFIHDFGKILLVDDEELDLSPDPQWAVVGDNFPTGCGYSDKNVFPETFAKNPDFNDPKYNTKLGIYSENCGLEKVQMSWGHDEYIYQIAKKYSSLPEKALYMLRYHSFYPWHKGGDYMHLCNEKDLKMLKWVQTFNRFDLYSKNKECPSLEEVGPYYKSIIEKYFGKDPLWW